MIELLLIAMCVIAATPIVRGCRTGDFVWPPRRSWFDLPH